VHPGPPWRSHGRHDLAAVFLLSACKSGSKASYLTTLGAALRRSREVTDAASVLLFAVAMSSVPEERKPLTSYAALMSDMRDYGRSRALLFELRKQYPEDRFIRQALARARGLLGKQLRNQELITEAAVHYDAADRLPPVEQSDGRDAYSNELKAFEVLGAADMVK
jgi:predicted Zn-dependent protease